MRKLLILIVCLFAPTSNAQEVGWLERASIGSFVMIAKLDTGADNSSVHATNISYSDEDGTKYVNFTIVNKREEFLTLRKPLVRFAHIKRKGEGVVTRPVVMLPICIDGTPITVPVNLADRSNFKYRMLLGRSFLKHGYEVSSSKMFILPIACE